jgi:hypothetical protein
MDATFISALSGVLGSLLGASATAATSWAAQKTLGRREVLREEMRKREVLYAKFIGECAKLLVDALFFARSARGGAPRRDDQTNCGDAPRGSTPVRASPINVRDQHDSREMRRITLEDGADPLKLFGEACRRELSSMRATL